MNSVNFKNLKHLQKQMLSLRIQKNTIYILLSVILYKIVLDLSYYFITFKVGDYVKFELHPNNVKLVESFILLLIIFFLMPKSSKKLSNIMVWLLVFLYYVPMLTLFALMDRPRAYMYAVTGFWILIFLLLKLPLISLSILKKRQSIMILCLIFVCLTGIVILLIFKYLGFSFNFDLEKVYIIRAKYIEMGIPLAGYFFNWVAYVVNPFFFAFFLVKKKWIPIIFITLLQIFIFSSTGLKTFLFALPFVLVLMWIITRKNPFAWMAIGLVGIILLGMGTYWLIDDTWIYFLFTRRVLLLPAHLSFIYYDFFSKNDFTFLSQHRIFTDFINYPYHLNPPYLIGEVYFNRPGNAANNGIYADAYMNFGHAGFVLWGFLLVIILKIVDSFSKNKDMRITVAAIAMPVIILGESALLTSLSTHGILLSLILLYLLPKKRNINTLEQNAIQL